MSKKGDEYFSSSGINSSFCLFVLVRPSTDWMMSTFISEATFTQSDSNADLLWKHLMAKSNVLLAICASHTSINFTHTINHHTATSKSNPGHALFLDF
jgi:hypothetical protein